MRKIEWFNFIQGPPNYGAMGGEETRNFKGFRSKPATFNFLPENVGIYNILLIDNRLFLSSLLSLRQSESS